MTGLRETLWQLLKEFWAPLLLALAWTIYVSWGQPITVQRLLTAFGPSFFLISWMTGQFFRVRKQQSVQGSLTSVDTRIDNLVRKLESAAEEITSVTTGGDSFCYFGIHVADNGSTMWTAVHEGRYPIYGVAARIVDLRMFESAMKSSNPLAADTVVNIGGLSPNQAKLVFGTRLSNDGSHDFNVFFSARNGFHTQLVRLRKINGSWLQATTVSALNDNGPSRYEKVSEGYPRDANGKPVGI